jgi:hypothetical protein
MKNSGFGWVPAIVGTLAVIAAIILGFGTLLSPSLIMPELGLIVLATCSIMFVSMNVRPPKNPYEATFPSAYWSTGTILCYLGALAAFPLTALGSAIAVDSLGYRLPLVPFGAFALFIALLIASVAFQRRHFRY